MDSTPLHVLALPGSMREGSYNKALLLAAQKRMPSGVTSELATIRGVPVYDGDAEAKDGVPPIVEALKARLTASDALLIATPEYNHGVPGPLKNAIDWLSRPPADVAKVFRGRPVALIGATPGRGGTRFSQVGWLEILHVLGMPLYAGEALYVDGAKDRFADGELVDAKTGELLERFVRGFVTFVRSCRGA